MSDAPDRASWERRFVTPFVRYKWFVLGIVTVLTAVLTTFVVQLEFDASIEVWFLEDDPDLVAYHDFLDRFEADEIVLLAVFADDVFQKDVLDGLHKTTEEIDANGPWIHRARSMTNVDVFDLELRDGEETIVIEPIVPKDVPENAEALAALRTKALANELIVDRLVNKDGTVAAVIVEIEGDADEIAQKIEVIDHVLAAAEQHLPDHVETVVTGGPVMDRAFLEYSEADFKMLVPVAVLVVLVLTFLVFRRFSVTLVPLVIVGVASIWLLGTMALLGRDVDILSSGIIVLVLAVGVADTVHVLSAYDRELALGADREDAVIDAVAELLVPCLFTSMTTVAGMLSLTVSDLDPIAWFGRLAALGVVFAFFLSVTLVPALLAIAKPPGSSHLARVREGRLAAVLTWMARPGVAWRRAIIVASLIIIAASSYGVSKLFIGSNPMNYFTEDDPIRVTTERVDEALGGTTTVEFLVHAPNEGFKNLERLQRIDELEEWIGERSNITYVDSSLDSLRELNRLWTDGEPESAVLPDNEQKVRALYGIAERDRDFGALLREDYEYGRITARVRMSKAGELASEMPEVEATLRDRYHDDELQVSATGFVKLMANVERYLLESQIQSLLLAFAVVTAMIALLLRSIRLAVFSMIPNMLPILMGMGVMSAAGIALDPGTVMIGSICLGLVVDDTVHFLVRLKRNLDQRQPLDDAIENTMHQTGRPIIVTSIILTASFFVLAGGSSFAPNLYFGVVSGLVIVFALIADLVMLPAALMSTRKLVGLDRDATQG